MINESFIEPISHIKTIVIHYNTAQVAWESAFVDTIACHRMIQPRQTFYVTECLYTTAGVGFIANLTGWQTRLLH